MKKIIAFLGISSFIITPLSSLVACKENITNVNKYFNVADINQIDPMVRNEVKYTSPIAQILISARHENANFYAFPALDYFLHNMETNNNGIVMTKDGDKVNVKNYISGYKGHFNKDFYNFNNNTYDQSGSNDYLNMNNLVLMNTLDSVKKQGNNFVTNPDTAWAMYDTGAYASTMAHFSDSVSNYAASPFNGGQYWGGDLTKAISSNLIDDNNLTSQGVDAKNQILSYTDNDSSKTKGQVHTFGKQVFPMANAVTNLYSLHDLSTAFEALQDFSNSKFYVLEYLTKLIPLVNTNFTTQSTFTNLLALPLILAKIVITSIYDNASNAMGTKDNHNVLLDFFANDIVNPDPNNLSGPGYVTDNGESKTYDLQQLMDAVYSKAFTGLTTGNTTYLDVVDNYKPGHLSDSLLYFYLLLGRWFDQAQLHPNNPNNSLINNPKLQKQFNKVLDKLIADKISAFKEATKGVLMTDEATTLINSLFSMINENFDIYDLLLTMAGFANWFYDYDPVTKTVSGNEDSSKSIRNVMAVNFNGDISKNTPESLAYQAIINENYGDHGGSNYELGSLFYMMKAWATGQVTDNPEYKDDNIKYIAANRFINNIIDPTDGFVGKIMQDANQKMSQDWFQTVFLSKNWHIFASGSGPGGQKLGPIFDKDHSKLIGVRYELDYYGPKDSSTDVLSHHTCKNINYYSPLGRVDGSSTPNTSNKPWTEADWQRYDGNGNAYSIYSNQIIYKYVVDFCNIPQEVDGLSPVIKDTAMSYLMTDFKWYYDLNNTGLPEEFC